MTTDTALFPSLSKAFSAMEREFSQIPEARMAALRELGGYIAACSAKGKPAQVLAVCTHNSRRSHLCQLWLAASAAYCGIAADTFSGGTEATALHPHTAAALGRAGFVLAPEKPDAPNPVYAIRWSAGQSPYRAFSKRYADPPNPTAGFAALMVCDEADGACPSIAGCDLRLPLPYPDPKASDGSGQEAQAYDASAWQIGREMLFAARHALKESSTPISY